MGTSYTFKCVICSYSVKTSGEVSYGMHYVVCPHVCMDCEIITDVIIGMFGQSYLKVELEDPKNYHVPDFVIEEKDKFYTCEKCNGSDLIIWDNEKNKCPKCNGTMAIDPSVPSVNWD